MQTHYVRRITGRSTPLAAKTIQKPCWSMQIDDRVLLAISCNEARQPLGKDQFAKTLVHGPWLDQVLEENVGNLVAPPLEFSAKVVDDRRNTTLAALWHPRGHQDVQRIQRRTRRLHS